MWIPYERLSEPYSVFEIITCVTLVLHKPHLHKTMNLRSNFKESLRSLYSAVMSLRLVCSYDKQAAFVHKSKSFLFLFILLNWNAVNSLLFLLPHININTEKFLCFHIHECKFVACGNFDERRDLCRRM